MSSFLIPLVIAIILGFLAGLGVGGGSLLLLWLTQVAVMQQPQARILNLLFYLPSAMISTFFRRKQQRLRNEIVVPALVTGCSAALCFTILSKYLDVTLLKKGFGALLIITGLRELFYRRRNAR